MIRDARAAQVPLVAIARGLCRAQPTMAPVWNAAIAALDPDLARFDRFAERVARSPAALARFGVEALTVSGAGPLFVATISFSRSVALVLEARHRVGDVHVFCCDGRPALEGRRLASWLAGRGLPVTYYTDAAIGHALMSAGAVVVGADAVTPEYFLNKSGTRMLAADASLRGVPFYVVASRDKFVTRALARRLAIRDGLPQEVWDDPPAGVEVRNPYFEAVPLDLVTAIISDTGMLGAGMVPDVCEAMEGMVNDEMLEVIIR